MTLRSKAKRLLKKAKSSLPKSAKTKALEACSTTVKELEQNVATLTNAQTELMRQIESLTELAGNSTQRLNCATNTIEKTQDYLAAEIARLANLSSASAATLPRAVANQLSISSYCNLEYIADGLAQAPNRILLAGWYGASNLGDELMLRTLLSYLSSEQLKRTSVLLCDVLEYDQDTLPAEVRKIHYPKTTWDLDYLASNYDTIIWGGGAILDDRQYTKDPLNFNTGNLFIRINERMIAQGKKVYALGLSANSELASETYAKRLSAIAEACKVFSLRDPLSLQSLVKAGVDQNNLSLCDDLVFGNKELYELASSKEKAAPEGMTTAGFAPICLPALEEQNKAVLQALFDYLRSTNQPFEIKLIPFYEVDHNDTIHLTKLKDELGNPSEITIAEYSIDIRKNPLTDCAFAICYRYHAALISYALGVKTLCVYWNEHPHYPNKMKHLSSIAQNSQHCISTSCFEGDSVTSFIKDACEQSHPELDSGIMKNQQELMRRYTEIL